MSLRDYEAKVTEFLMQPENLRAALEVADHIEKVKRRLVLNFWQAIAHRVQADTAQLPAWVMQVDTDDKLSRGTYYGAGITVRPKAASHDPGFFAFKLADDAAKGVFYGISCNGERESDLRSIAAKLPEFRAVQKQIETFPTEDWGRGWLIGRYLDELTNYKGLRESENLIRMSKGSALADKASAEFINLFQKCATEIESINLALAASAGT